MKKICLMFVSVFLLFGLAVPIQAMGEMSHWEGMDSTELIFMDSNSPIVVNKETITLDYFEMPDFEYGSKKELLKDENQITLTYELYNPTSETITTTLAYPFGDMSESYNYVYQIGKYVAEYYQDNEKYEITVNDEDVEKELRHTIIRETANYPYRFSEQDILDERVEHSFYYPELPVTVYSFEVSDVKETQVPALFTTIALDSKKSQYFSTSQSGRELENYIHEVWLQDGNTFDLYVFGEPLKELPIWEIYFDGTQEQKLEGTVTLTATKEMTFDDFVKETMPTDFEVSYIDWYNTTINEMENRKRSFGLIQSYHHYRKLSYYLMRWHVFEVTIEPNETITTTIKAPLYPTVEETEDAFTVCFNHLASIASKEYKEVEVQIHTNFETNDERLEKNENGYQLLMDSSEDKDIQFTLSKKQSFDFSEFIFKASLTIITILWYGIPICFIGLIIMFFWNNRLSNIKKD